jgi:hypothetical protein
LIIREQLTATCVILRSIISVACHQYISDSSVVHLRFLLGGASVQPSVNVKIIIYNYLTIVYTCTCLFF